MTVDAASFGTKMRRALTTPELRRADAAAVAIPMLGMANSLNVATIAAILPVLAYDAV